MKVFINSAAAARYEPILGRLAAVCELSAAGDFGAQIATSQAALVRSKALLGAEFASDACVLIAGLGGVGGAAASALARCGLRVVGADADVFEPSNQNRQLHSEHTGAAKAEVYAALYGILGIHTRILASCTQGGSEQDASGLKSAKNAPSERLGILASELIAAVRPTLLIDCIDDVAAKTALILAAERAGCAVLSSGGAAKRIDAGAVQIARWDQVAGCALSRAVRARLRRAGYSGRCRVVYSTEPPAECEGLGSVMPVTASFGLRLASEAIKLLRG